jgi:hypothetical protein
MYHYTGTGQLDSVLRDGLQVRQAKGETYGEPNAVWGSTQEPDALSKDYVEAHIPYDEYEPGSIGLPMRGGKTWGGVPADSAEGIAEYNTGNNNFAFPRDVPPEAIVAHSTPALRTLHELRSYGIPKNTTAREHYGEIGDEATDTAIDMYDRERSQVQFSRRLMKKPGYS